MLSLKETTSEYRISDLEKESKCMKLISELTLNVKLYKVEDIYFIFISKSGLHISEMYAEKTVSISSVASIVKRYTGRTLDINILNNISDFNFKLL